MSGFGRDEMDALLGGGISEHLTRPKIAGETKKAPKGVDVADMTTAETAAYLLEQNRVKAVKAATLAAAGKGQQHRYRTQKVRAYHQLLAEETADVPPSWSKQRRAAAPADSGESSDAEPELVRRPRPTKGKAAPLVERKRRRYDSDSSSSDDDSQRPRRRADSSSSEEEQNDRRRQRLLQRKRQDEDELVVEQPHTEKELPDLRSRDMSSDASGESDPGPKPIAKPQSSSSDSSSGSSSSSDDDSSSDDSSSEEKDAPILAKPAFVPKHKRLQKSADEIEKEEAEKMAEHERVKTKRRIESRALVQQVVEDTKKQVVDTESALEGITGARNEMPNDDDDEGENGHDEWEVRELVRLVEDWDLEQARMREERELARRRAMTDEERLAEDMASGRYQKPGGQREEAAQLGGRYYHKGAFYMDESEWDKSDVRRKADEYAKAATGDDKVDKRVLPKVMQVKKFGFANASRYKGLATEDTTDRHSEMLPILSDKKKDRK